MQDKFAFINYPMKLIIQSVVFMYVMYSFANFLLYICILMFLKDFPKLKRYYRRKWYLIFLLPVFNFVVFWFRFAGIINSIRGQQTWRVRNAKEEWDDFNRIVKKDFFGIHQILETLRNEVNENEET